MFPCLKNHSFVKTRQKTILAELYQIHHLAWLTCCNPF
jgi:hypothetical protein